LAKVVEAEKDETTVKGAISAMFRKYEASEKVIDCGVWFL
jgi:hypothetical protein